jgi:hypothetical protein
MNERHIHAQRLAHGVILHIFSCDESGTRSAEGIFRPRREPINDRVLNKTGGISATHTKRVADERHRKHYMQITANMLNV